MSNGKVGPLSLVRHRIDSGEEYAYPANVRVEKEHITWRDENTTNFLNRMREQFKTHNFPFWTLGQQQVRLSQRLGMVCANMAAGTGGGLAAATLVAVGKGALIGGALGSLCPIPGVGTVAGAVIGGVVGALAVGLVATFAGYKIGRQVGKYKAGHFTLDSLKRAYAPGSARFNRVVQRAGLELGDFSESDKECFMQCFGKILEARAANAQWCGRGFLDDTVRMLAEQFAEADSRGQNKQLISDHVTAVLQRTAELNQLIVPDSIGFIIRSLGLIPSWEHLPDEDKERETNNVCGMIYTVLSHPGRWQG